MKYICLSLLLFTASKLFAQTSFEGKVRYTATSVEKPNDATLTIYFGKPGIRLEIIEANKADREPETLIINLDSGKIFTLVTNEKKYKETILKKQIGPKTLAGKNIAGYTTKAIRPEFNGMSRDFTSLFGNAILFAADDLRYTIPVEYLGCPELMMVNNGRIVLGGDFYFPEEAYTDLAKDTLKEKDALFRVTANEVLPQKIPDSLFQLSAGYEKWSYDYSLDSTATYSDTAAMEPVKPNVQPKKKAPKKKSSTTKQNATRRKNE